MKFICFKCQKERNNSNLYCSCGGLFRPVHDFRFSSDLKSNFPYVPKWVSLGETVTPLIERQGLYLKLDYFSPTYSYKDRGSITLISSLLGKLPEGSDINEDSSGNAGASIAAYASAAGFKPNIYVPQNASEFKIRQIISYGAKIHTVQGSRENVMESCKNAPGFYASHVLRPEFRDGIRMLSYEIMEQLNWHVPDAVVMPVSAGTLLLGVIYGFRHLLNSGEISRMPQIIAVQTEFVSPLYHRMEGLQYTPPDSYVSVADALVSQSPPLLDEMYQSLKGYGKVLRVSENEIINSRNKLARSGILVEYSSAVAYAGALKLNGLRPVVILTGNGLKSSQPKSN
jgi:threonine synthase